MKKIKYIFMFLVILVGAAWTIAYKKAFTNPYPNTKADTEIPQYEEVKLDHKHNYNGKEFLPIIASAVIDIDGDGTSELFLGGGHNQQDQLYKYTKEGFEPIQGISFDKDDFDATYGASIADFNNDGKDDLLIARESGGYLYLNRGSSFEKRKINIHLNSKSRAVSFSLGDINNDGHIDIYVSGYLTRKKMEGQNIFNKKDYGGTSVLLLNNGDNTFKNITESAGMTYIHNTFLGIFVDIDGDLDLDLIAAHDTGTVKTWRNNGDLTFSDVKNPFSDMLGYPMGIGAGDYNNDGRIDFYFSNVGPTAPDFLAKGDIRDDQIYYKKLMLMENLGGFKFKDSSVETKVSEYEFSWGITIAELNNDGRQDIIISQNYVDLPFHKLLKLPGRVLLQRKDQTFASVEKEAGAVNRNYEIASVLGDFNGDGYLDQVRANLAGKSKAFISKGGANNYLRVALPTTAKTLGSKVSVTLSDGSKLYDWHVSGEGLCSDQERVLTFGLGKDKTAVKVSVLMPSGRTLNKTLSNEKNKLVRLGYE